MKLSLYVQLKTKWNKMQVEIIEDTFRNSEFVDFQHFINICLYKNRHLVRVPIHRVRTTQHFNDLSERDRLMLETQYNAEAMVSKRRSTDVRVSQLRQSWEYFNLEEAIRYVQQPLSIILENSLNDQYFINTIFKSLSINQQFDSYFTNGWIEFVNGGGCDNVENVIEGKAKSYEHLPKVNYRYLRAYVLLDSDKELPTSAVKASYQKLMPKLDEMGVHYHIFYKRAMENYLPDLAFGEIGTIRQSYKDAYLALSAEQKDFFSIKNGFGRLASRDLLQPEIGFFFATVSDEDFEILNQGSDMPNFKAEFPKYMEHYNVHRVTLKARTAHQADPDELENILKDIIDLI
jgi:hypothetical protein